MVNQSLAFASALGPSNTRIFSLPLPDSTRTASYNIFFMVSKPITAVLLVYVFVNLKNPTKFFTITLSKLILFTLAKKRTEVGGLDDRICFASSMKAGMISFSLLEILRYNIVLVIWLLNFGLKL